METLKKQDKKQKVREVVVMLIHNHKNEVLFTKRSPKRKFLPGVWALPSGHINVEQEGFQEAVIREGKEELNIDISHVNLHETIDNPDGDGALVYLVDIPANAYKGNPVISTDEFDSIAWMKMEDFFEKFKDEEIGPTLRYLRPKFQRHEKQD